jgi:hypothetical protein
MIWRLGVVILVLVGISLVQPAQAHQALEIGDYLVEFVWEQEPPLAGQANAVVLRVRGKPMIQSELGKLTLITPLDGMVISGDVVPVSVQIEPAAGVSGLTWQLSVDDQRVATPPADQSTVLVQEVAPGAHTVTVALADADQQTVGTPLSTQVTVRGAGNTTMTIPPPLSVNYVAVDLSGLTFEIVHHEEQQPLIFSSIGEGAGGQYRAPYTPAQGGIYLLRVQGVLDDQPVDTQLALDVVRQQTWTEQVTNLLRSMGWWLAAGVIGLIGVGVWLRIRLRQ